METTEMSIRKNEESAKNAFAMDEIQNQKTTS